MSKPNMEKKNLRLEKGGDQNVEKQELWRLSKSKEKETKGRKDVSKSGMKIVLWIGGSQIREEKLFEVE